MQAARVGAGGQSWCRRAELATVVAGRQSWYLWQQAAGVGAWSDRRAELVPVLAGEQRW